MLKREIPVKGIVRALGVSRSNLLEQRSKHQKAPKAAPEPEPADGAEVPETAENGLLLARIRELVGERPSYGYRRVTALLNRERTERVNPKRIYRIMRRNKLLLERCTGDGRGRKQTQGRSTMGGLSMGCYCGGESVGDLESTTCYSMSKWVYLDSYTAATSRTGTLKAPY